jgi:hypothetical protein
MLRPPALDDAALAEVHKPAYVSDSPPMYSVTSPAYCPYCPLRDACGLELELVDSASQALLHLCSSAELRARARAAWGEAAMDMVRHAAAALEQERGDADAPRSISRALRMLEADAAQAGGATRAA